MAVISDDHLFLHIYKTGGTTYKHITGEHDSNSIGAHACLADVKDHYLSHHSKEEWDSLFKFAFVRDPFTWYLSHYQHIKNTSGHNYHDLMKDKSYEYFLDWYFHEAIHFDRPKGANKYVTLEGFLRDSDGIIDIDHVARFENYEEECKFLVEKTIGKKVDEVPHRNKGRYNDPVESFYPPEVRKKAEKYFAGDLKLFAYG